MASLHLPRVAAPSRVARVLMALVMVVLIVIVGADSFRRPLANPDEGRYSEIAREMALSSDWVTPRLNGFKYFEKPPLQHWATAWAFRTFGESEYSARLYTAACTLIGVVAAGFTATRLASPRTGLIVVAVLLSSPYFVALGTIVTLDMGLAAWLAVAFCAFLLAQQERTPRMQRRWMLVAWAAAALAVLSKGLVGIVFPLAALLLHCVLSRDWTPLRRLEWRLGIPLFLVLVLPWFFLVAQANPEFMHFFFVHEHLDRYLSGVHRREQPWWYFLPIFLGAFLPWSLALIPACIDAWRMEASSTQFQWRRCAILWSAFVLVFFSASGSKLPAYILPIVPVLALVVGDWIDRTDSRRLATWLAPALLVAVAFLVFGWNAPLRVKDAWTRELYFEARPWILGGGVVLGIGYGIAAGLLRSGAKGAALVVVAIASLLCVATVEDGYDKLSPRQSGRDLAEAMRPHLEPSTRLYAVRHYDQTLPFYLRREVMLVDYSDEFALGQRSEPGRSLASLDAFVADWARPGATMAVLQPDAYDELLRANVPMVLLHRDERRIAVRKP